MVEAPRLGPCLPAPLRTSCRAPQSTPSLSQKLASSDAITVASAVAAPAEIKGAGATFPSQVYLRWAEFGAWDLWLGQPESADYYAANAPRGSHEEID